MDANELAPKIWKAVLVAPKMGMTIIRDMGIKEDPPKWNMPHRNKSKLVANYYMRAITKVVRVEVACK